MSLRPLRMLMFDIDGTLFFSSQDLGGKAMIQAMHRTFPHGSGFSRHGVHLGGRVDSAIAQDVAMSGGVARDLFMEHKDQFVCAYAEEMARVLEEGRRHGIVRPCLNVIELLNRLNCEEDVVLGIVSGNFKEIGPIKLKAVGIDPEMFKVCAYGSDHSSRNELPKIALQRANELFGADISPRDSLVIGDTAEDIACARDSGIPVLAMGTGCTPLENLTKLEPDYLLENFSDLDSSISILLSRT